MPGSERTPMRADDMRLLWDYSFWATGHILAATERLTAEQYNATPLSGSPSVRHILSHALNAEQGWRQGLQGTPREQVTGYSDDELATPAQLAAAWRAEEATTRVWLATLDDAALAADRWGTPLWAYLAHVANHATQHRSEAAMLLTHFDQSPGDVDMVFFLEGQEE